MAEILIKGAALAGAADEGYLFISGPHIAAVGSGSPPAALEELAGRVIDARHMAALPGLVNGHTHLSQTFLRGLAGDRPLLRWLREVIWPAQAAFTPEDMYLAALLGLVENVRCGATTVVQHQKLPGRAFVDAVGRATEVVGVRMLLARGWVDLGRDGEPLGQILADLDWLYTTWHGAAGGRIRTASGPMAPWRCSDDALRQITVLARSHGLPTHIHIAETADEVGLMLERCGQRPVAWLAGLGCLGPDTQLVHAVHLDDAELDLVAEAGSVVVYCPTSNMYLASGAADVPAMVRRGIPVALGTDGPASNDSQDLLECAKVGILLAKHAASDARALQPSDMVEMLWHTGARLWTGMASPAGEMEPAFGPWRPGAPADLTLVNLNHTRCQPLHDMAAALVFGAGGPDVHSVIVDGQLLLDAGRVTMLDEQALLEECRRAAAALLRRAGIRG